MMTCLAAAIAACVLVLAAGASAQETQAADWGKPVLTDDFERAQLGEQNWEIPSGTCEIKDGRLVTTGKGNFYLFFKQKLASNMAIEFDAMVPDTKEACDLTAVLSANEFEPAIRHYQAAFGTNGNKRSAIHRGKLRTEGDEVVKTSDLVITPGKWYHVRGERQDECVRLFVDGRLVLEYKDRLGFAPESHNRVGIYSYGPGAQFDNVKVYACPISAAFQADALKKWDRVYDDFNEFCVANFGAEKEPLVYELFGKELKFLDEGAWRHVSETSACIAWETNLPAKSHVEYGLTEKYGQKTADEERPFYLHVHNLKGLETGKTYHYRVVSVDERGNRIQSPDATFQPQPIAGAIRIPGDLGKAPYDLNKAGATYVLTEDIVADSTALRITAKDVTLDLNGHTITFNEKHGAAEAVPSTVNIRKPFHGFTGAPGIAGTRESAGAKILNGSIVQGKAGSGNCCDPLLGVRAKEIAGVTVDFYGYQMNGFIWAGSVEDLHHNVVLDKGTELVDRHWAVRAVSDCKKVHHNLIKRCRQRGVSGGDEIVHNEIWQDSFATNALGISGKEVRGNRILGGGVHVCAISWEQGMQVIGNLIHLQAQKSKYPRWTEYGDGTGSSCNGIRLTQYGGGNTEQSNPLYLNNLYSGNIVVVNSREGSGARGVQFSSHINTKNLICRDSTIKVLGLDENSGGACVVTQGRTAENALPLYYRNCTLVATNCHVKFGDGYSVGSNHRFENCKFVRVGNKPDYHTFLFSRAGWSDRHVLLDCEFGEGTRYDDVSWDGTSARAWYSVAWTLTVKTAPLAKVTIKDALGAEVFSGAADDKGLVSAPLTQCVIRPKEYQPGAQEQPVVKLNNEHVKEAHTPHTVTVEKDGKTAQRTVTMDKKQEIELKP